MVTKDEIKNPLLPVESFCFGYGRKRGMLQHDVHEFAPKKANLNTGINRLIPNELLIADEKSLLRTMVEEVCAGTTTPRYAEGVTLSAASQFELLPMPVLENICRCLKTADLCQLSQVNKYSDQLFSKDEFWMWRAEEREIVKAVDGRSWKWNVMACDCKFLFARRLNEAPVFLKGDITVIDPFKVFFTGSGNEIRRQLLRTLMNPFLYKNAGCVVTYRGIPAVFVTSKCWDSDTAFEITRKGTSLGVDSAMSKILAAIPKKLVDILIEENGTELEGGVFVEGVNGEFRSSRDGDFIIRDSSLGLLAGKCGWCTDEEELECADIICATGGSWTISDDDSSDDEEDVMKMTDEEVARILREDPDNWL